MSEHTWLSTKEASILLGVSQRTIQNWVDDGKIKSTRTIGGHRRLNREDVRKRLIELNAGAMDLPETLQTSVSGDNSVLRVLVVEDDYAILRLCELQFKQFAVPHYLYLAANGYQGLMMVGKYAPHVIFTDLRMPQIDGLRMIQEIINMPDMKGVKIVAVTGLETKEIIKMGTLPEGLLVLPKPIPFNTVETILFQQATILNGGQQQPVTTSL